MADVRHTPGPWEFDCVEDATTQFARRCGIQETYHDYEIRTAATFQLTPKFSGPRYIGKVYRDKANARLIAAAPEMAELLRDMRGICEWGCTPTEPPCFNCRARVILQQIDGATTPE